MLMPTRANEESYRKEENSIYEDSVVNVNLLNQLVPFGSAIETIFNPLFSKMLRKNPPIIKCSLDKFMKKFKIDSDILEPMMPIWKEFNCILAGGKMIDFFFNKRMSNSLNDYDIFFMSENPSINDSNSSLSYFLEKEYKYNINATLSHVLELSKDNIKIQLIKSIFANQYDILEDFDIRACAICTDGKYVYWIKKCLKDNIDKKIVMTNPRSTIHSFYRVIKYIEKGYDIRVPDLALASIKFLDSLCIKKDDSSHLIEITDRSFLFDRNAMTMDYEEFAEQAVYL